MNTVQLRAILWLRCRIFVNQWARGSDWNTALGILGVGLLLVLAGGLLVGGILTGTFFYPTLSPGARMFFWDGVVAVFLFIWLLGIVTELQRSEWIDLQRLMHLPFSLKGVFFMNYLVSHVCLPLIFTAPAVFGMVIGSVIGAGWEQTLLVFPILGGLFLLTSWTYYLRGWLVALMINERRRRFIVMGVTAGVILVTQLPNIYFNLAHRDSARGAASEKSSRYVALLVSPELRAAHKFIPPLWIGYSASNLAKNNPWPALWTCVASVLLGAWGLRNAYRATCRAYQKAGGRIAEAKEMPEKFSLPVPTKTFTFPGLSDETAAVASASFRSMWRAPEIKMALFSALLTVVIFGGIFFRGSSAGSSFQSVIISWAFFIGLIQLLFNQFGYDRDGFRAYVLAPLPRRAILLGKNLALIPFVFGLGILLLVALNCFSGFSLLNLTISLFQWASAFLIYCMVGNSISILLPYRVVAGSLKPTKMPASIMICSFLSMLVMPILLLPLLFGPLLARWFSIPGISLNLLVSMLVTGVLVGIYGMVLNHQANLLASKELDILKAVVQQVE